MGQAGSCVPELPRTREALGAGWLLPLPPWPPAASRDATMPTESPEPVPASHVPSFHSAVQSGLAPHQARSPSGSWRIWCDREELMLQEHVRRTPEKVSPFFPVTVSPCCPLPATTTLPILTRSSLGKGDRDDGGILRPRFGWLGSLSGVIVFATRNNNNTDCSCRTVLPHGRADPALATPFPQLFTGDTVSYCSR